jgi:hypothetical protein
MVRASSQLWCVVVLAAAAAPQSAAAHDLKADVNPAVEPIRVEAGYDDGMPADGARVTVLDAHGSTIAAGSCDARGIWQFGKPGPGRYRIVVEQAGHRDEVILDVPEAAVPLAMSRWRLDKNLGLAIGLAILLGGTGTFVIFRRRVAPGSPTP